MYGTAVSRDDRHLPSQLRDNHFCVNSMELPPQLGSYQLHLNTFQLFWGLWTDRTCQKTEATNSLTEFRVVGTKTRR
jgi:hypothetical protein